MGSEKKQSNFVMLRRDFKEHLLERKVTWDEYNLLLFFIVSANYVGGYYITSYTSLAADIGYYSQNRINKLALSLRGKGYIKFEEHRGSKAPIKFYIHKYQLANGHLLDINKPITAQSEAELPTNEQNFKDRRNDLIKGMSID